MRRHFFSLLLVMPLIASAGIVENNSGLDRNTQGNWSFSGTVMLGTARDNIFDNGDTWLAQNAGCFVKSPYGATDGTKDAEGFVGIYKGATGDMISMSYSFTATTAMSQQEWIAKGIIWRTAGAYSGRLQFSVNPRGEGFTVVDVSDWFGRSSDGVGIIDMGAVATGTALNGPTASYTTDLSSLNIESGDSVVYRFSMNSGDSAAGTSAARVGLGVQLIPEPATFLLFVIGGVGAWLVRRNARSEK